MAKLTNPLMSHDARGKMGSLIYEKNNKTNYVKFNGKSKKKPSPSQIENQIKWGEGVEYWRGLTEEQKDEWRDLAKEKKGSGFNYFMKYWMSLLAVGVYGVNEYNYCVY